LATKASAVTKWPFEIESSASGLKDLKLERTSLTLRMPIWTMEFEACIKYIIFSITMITLTSSFLWILARK
jgi:hypothetical protein